jgi:CheY-like chemotaxis protein
MPAGGRLTIATSTREFGADAQVGDEEIVPGTYVLLAISDTGTGISEQVLPHIFEPFFTTKSSSQGSGLGLATVHGIVRQSGGHIRVHSREQVGTSFEIYLPVAVAGEQHQEIVQPPVHDMRGNETVLLVEDDEQVRSLVSRVLDRYGYRVIEAHNGVQAQEIADTLGEAIQVLVTDIVMDGGINGIQLAQILAHRHHHLSIICMSGYTDYSLGALHQIDAPVVFLQKPFAPQTLVRNLRGLLESSPPAI